MNSKLKLSILVASLALLAGCDTLGSGHNVFLTGGTAIVDGHSMSRDKYEEAKANGTLDETVDNAGAKGGTRARSGYTGSGPRGTICATTHYYDEFPSDAEKFSCEGLGEATRADLLNQGWHIDFMEKVPAPGGGNSSRGLPLNTYKMVLSR